jgi:hypothetical protein
MSGVGQSRPNWAVCVMSAFLPIATKLRTLQEVRFVPLPDIAIAFHLAKASRKKAPDDAGAFSSLETESLDQYLATTGPPNL